MSSSKKFTSSSQSPLSSGGSLGTPETNITSFSPDEPRKPSLSLTTPLKAGHQDPFISTGTKLKVEQKLSATATAFQPYTLYGAMGIPMVANGSGSGSGLKPGTTQYLENVVATSNLAAAGANHLSSSTQYDTFSTDIGISRCMEVRIPNGDAKLFLEELLKELEQNGQPLGKPNHIGGVGNVASLRFTNISDAMAAYSTMKMNHSLCAVTYIEPEELNRRVTPNSKTAISRHEGQVILTAKYPIGYSPRKKDFEDSLRAALAVEGKLFACAKLPATEIGTLRMVAEFCDCTHAVRAIKRLDGTSIKNVVVSIDHWSPDLVSQLPNHRLVTANTPTRSSGEQPTVEESLGHMSLGNGRIPALASIGTPGIANMAYAGHPHTQLSMSSTGLVMGGMYPSPSILGFPASYAGLTTPPRQYTAQNDFVPTFTPVGFGHQGYSYHQNQYQALTSYQGSPSSFRFFGSPSPTGGRDIIHGGRSSGRRQNAVKIPHNSRNRQHSNALSHHNHVDIHRIRQGIDVRTTVMLRNIPNKVDQSMLKSIVDESSHGKYDFMYLRIDFSNDCNVGYAFINFTDPLDIINFVIARSNQKWHRFKSDKVAEISYATIQGKDCLVQKFRNSSVMLEPPHYRPKLFFTANDPFGRAGEEEEFPTSDNASKLKRSCENAEHVGLFAPSAGQHLRDEQRRRRSQFDRGTSFAENEEFDLEDEIDGELEYAPFYPYSSY